MHRLTYFLAASALVLVVLLAAIILVDSNQPAKTNQIPLPFTIKTYDPQAAWNGNITFGLIQLDQNNLNKTIGSHLIIMDTNGQVYYTRQTSGQDYWVAKNLAPKTLMFLGEPTRVIGNDPLAATHFWNYRQNTTNDFPKVISHHDIEYNPVNGTFLTLQPELKTVNNQTVLFDKMQIMSGSGEVLWTWDTFDHIPLTEAGPYNVTVTINQTQIYDFTHANAIYWDYNSSIIYLNLRHTNTFYKINQTDGNIIWACGEYGNFTLLTQNGTQTKSLWYHSHGLKPAGQNEFVMFDNDFTNETNPNNCRSRMLKIVLNESAMTCRESWSWEAPKSYWSTYFGSVEVLPNGNMLGVFGTPTHEFAENKPWDFNNTGAVIAEVTPSGELVRTITFPVGWEIYRVQQIYG